MARPVDKRVLLQEIFTNTMGMTARFLFRLGGHSKQASEEFDLAGDVSLGGSVARNADDVVSSAVFEQAEEFPA